jgi:hypothetical protein
MLRTRSAAASASLAVALAFGVGGCVASEEATSASSETAFTLNPQQCANPTVTTSPHLDASGAPIPGTSRTTLNGCILAQAGESSSTLLARAVSLLVDTPKLRTLKNDAGQPRFPTFTPSAATGTLETGLVQDISVTFDITGAPATKLRLTRRQSTDQTVMVLLQNVSPLATSGSQPLTVATEGGISLNARLQVASNGIMFVGTTDVTLTAEPDQAMPTSFLVRNLYAWLTTGLNAD